MAYRSGIKDMSLSLEYDKMKIYSQIKGDCVNPYLGVYRCRQCANCLSARSREWVARLMQEKETSLCVVPFCLTYTEDMLKDCKIGASVYDLQDYAPDKILSEKDRRKGFGYKYNFSKDYCFVPVLSKDDVQKFLKRLRKKLSKYDEDCRIKYFIKGEYGDEKARPHYHGIVFLKQGDVNENVLKQCILFAWFNGIYKERGKKIDMSHSWNWNKSIKVKP